MDRTSARPARMRAAIMLSIAFHLCGLALLALLFGGADLTTNTTAESAPIFGVTTIVRRPPPRRIPVIHGVHRRAAQRAPRAATPLATLAVRSADRPVPPRRRAPLGQRPLLTVAPSIVVPAHVARVAGPLRTAPPARIALLAPPPSAAVEEPTPAPVETKSRPSPTPAPAASASPNGFDGLFSQNYPPALGAPSVVANIRAKLAGHGRISVDVDESGHATSVSFDPPPADATAQDVRAQLLALTYVPADCNGLHCAGMLEISY